MAVTITSQPATITPIGNGVEFEFSISASGDGGDLVYSIGYQLYDSNDTAITDLEQIPYTSAGASVDFAKDIEPLIYTTIQQSDDYPSFEHDATFHKNFYVKYGQIEFDSSTCTTETSGVSADSTEFTVINTAYQWWEDYSGLASGSPSIRVMSDMPIENYVDRSQTIPVWLWRIPGDGSIYAERTNYDRNGNTTGGGTLFQTLSSGAHIIDASPGSTIADWGATDIDNLSRYEIEIRPGVLSSPLVTYYFYVNDCGDATIKELHWIEPKGGQASIVFDRTIESANVTANNYEVRTPRNESIANYGLNYGKTRANAKTVKQITMQKSLRNQEDMRVFLDGLFASQQHFVKYPKASGYTMCKFILQDGQYQISDNKESILLTVTGEIHLPINRV